VAEGDICRTCTSPMHDMYTFNPSNASCDVCPPGATCWGSYIIPAEGMWHSHPRSTVFHQCTVPGACSYTGRVEALKVGRPRCAGQLGRLRALPAAAGAARRQPRRPWPCPPAPLHRSPVTPAPLRPCPQAFGAARAIAGTYNATSLDAYEDLQCGTGHSGKACGNCGKGFGRVRCGAAVPPPPPRPTPRLAPSTWRPPSPRSASA
jgi:hypothetical protein